MLLNYVNKDEIATSLGCDWTCKDIVLYVLTLKHSNITKDDVIAQYCHERIYEVFEKHLEYTPILGVLIKFPNH